MAAGKLREAAARGNLEKVLHLIEEGVKIQPDENGRNALHLAASAGHADVVAALLLAGCDVNVPDSSGCTALQRAAAEGHLEVVKQLIKYGADVNRQDSVHGNTALHEASWKGYSRSVAALAKAKANLHLKNCGGFAALHLCCQNGHNQSCRELLLAGCNPDLQNNYGDTPLHTSARYGHAGVTRILISANCRVSDQNKNGDTALHIAAAMGRRKLTRILLEAGCDKSLKNKQNETAKDIATRKDLNEILVILNNPTISRSKNKTGKSTYEKDHNDKKRGKNESGNSSKDSSSRQKEKKKHKNAHKVHFERPTGKQWSPYGCHYYPDPKAFPQPKLDSLPHEPLKKGEQYYLDLAGNICKGPVGVGYTCYCAPFFRHMEARLDRDKQELKEHIDQAHQRLDQKVTNLEHRTQGQISELTQCVVAERARCDQRHLHLAQWLSRGAAGRSSERVRTTEPPDILEPFPVPRARSLEQLLDSHVEWKDLYQGPGVSGYTVGGNKGLRNAQDHRSLEMLADDNGNATWGRQHYQNSAHVLRSREQKQQKYYERTSHEEPIPKGQMHQPYIQELTKRVKQKDQEISKVKQDCDKRLENPKAEKNAANWRGQPHRRSAHELPFCTNPNSTNNHEHSNCPDKHNRSFDTLLDQKASAWQDHSQYRSINELPSALHQRKHEIVFGKVQTDHHRSLNNVLVDKDYPAWSEKGRGTHEAGVSVGETNAQAPQTWKLKTQKRVQETTEDKQSETQIDNGAFNWKEQPLCRSVHEMVQRYQSVHANQAASSWSASQMKQNRGDSSEGQRLVNAKANELKEVPVHDCRKDEKLNKSHYRGGVERYHYHNDDDNQTSESSEGENDENEPEVKNPDYENVMAACQWRPERTRLMSDISYHPCGAVYSPTMESSDLHNDSGYSTKLYGSSKGPSPSLSGQLECEGILPPQALFNQNKVSTVCEQNQTLQSIYVERSEDTKTNNVVTASLV